jgi:enoyl-[acyl-carrier protein] reductase II
VGQYWRVAGGFAAGQQRRAGAGEIGEEGVGVKRPVEQDQHAFEAIVRFRPPAISFHLGVPADLIDRVHEAGILWIRQVMNRRQAEEATTAGADVIVAQGSEAGGNSGWVSTMVLVPQVVDVAGAMPVVAARGIADGRGLAAALALGPQGVSLGTRFLASTEVAVAEEWKQRIVAADALDAVKVEHSDRVLPPFNRPGGPAQPRRRRDRAQPGRRRGRVRLTSSCP